VEQLRLIFAELYATTTRNAVAITAPWNLIDAEGRLRVDDGAKRAADATLTELTWWALALRTARRDHPYAA
jgi:hypothetical protein